jgi:hypothetical protein
MTKDGSRGASKKVRAELCGHFARKRVARLILLVDSPHGNYETIPGIDRRDCQRQIGEFLFREMLACFLKDFVGNMTLPDVCDRFRPGESDSPNSKFSSPAKCFATTPLP